MNYRIRNRFVLLADLLIIVLSILVSFVLRLEYAPDFVRIYLEGALYLCTLALVIKPAAFYFFGLYRRLWIYASINELKLIAVAVTTSSILVAILFSTIKALFWPSIGFPRSVLIIDWIISVILIGGSRFIYRIAAESKRAPQNGRVRKVIVVGAGDAGAIMVKEMLRNSQINLQPVGFLDDDPAKKGHALLGLPVFGPISMLGDVLNSQQIDEVIIAIPSAPGRIVRTVADICRPAGVSFRTMPGIYELLGGKVNVNRLREVEITDLLRREPVRIHEEMIGHALKGQRVLVTGAGGSIGRELCRQIARWDAASLVMLGHGENSIFEALLELRQDFPTLEINPVIADIRDKDRLAEVFEKFRPQIVFHAAAHKHVPLMQINVSDAISNNVIGTKNVLEVADRFDASRLVLISTDKAVKPANVYGATKRLAELLTLEMAVKTGKAFSVVRFGNVLGSRGSVVPLFKKMIAVGGPIQITHPEMFRFFMTIPEAVHLVLQAASMGEGGEAFLLDMGEQVKILDLAEDLIRLSGLEPGRDIDVIFTGIRPGEKLREELWETEKTYTKTAHPDVFRSESESGLINFNIGALVDQLQKLVNNGDDEQVISLLDGSIPGCNIRETISTDILNVVD